MLSITSDAAVEAYAGWGGYGAAKAALEQACNVLAAEEAAVRVWWVDPGDLRTRMHQQAYPGEDISDRQLPEAVTPGFLRLLAERMPSGRYRAADLMPAGARRMTVAFDPPHGAGGPRAARGAGHDQGRRRADGQPAGHRARSAITRSPTCRGCCCRAT